MGLSEEHKLIGIVGRLFPIKNHELFLKSAALISAREPRPRGLLLSAMVLPVQLGKSSHS